jgi:hypothetical protein
LYAEYKMYAAYKFVENNALGEIQLLALCHAGDLCEIAMNRRTPQ